MSPEWVGEARLYPEIGASLVAIKNRTEKAREVCQKRYQSFLQDNNLTPEFIATFLVQPPMGEFSFRFREFPQSSYTLWSPKKGEDFVFFDFENQDPLSLDPQLISLGFDGKDFRQNFSLSVMDSKLSQRHVSTSFFPGRVTLMNEILMPGLLFPVPSDSPFSRMDQYLRIICFYQPTGVSEKFELSFGFANLFVPLGVFEKDRWAVRYTKGFFFTEDKWRFAYQIGRGNFGTSFQITIDPLLAIDNISNLRPAFEEVGR